MAQDKLPVHWGKVADMAVSGEQLVGHNTMLDIVCTMNRRIIEQYSGTGPI